MKLFIYDELTP